MKNTDDTIGDVGLRSVEAPARCSEQRGERRHYPRVLSAILQTEQDRVVVTVSDLSLSGARIWNAPPCLMAGDTLTLSALLHGRNTLTVPCTVIHIRGNEAHLEVGVRFDDIQPAEWRALSCYLHLRADGGRGALAS